MKSLCIEKELIIDEDYRRSKLNEHHRFFYPLNEDTNFKINLMFRKLTKEKKANKFYLENYPCFLNIYFFY